MLPLLLASVLASACDVAVPRSPRNSWGPCEQAIGRPSVRFAVIGDYGRGTLGARDVAALVVGWRPDLVVTTGDNNYPYGAAGTIDGNVGRYYQRFIAPYHGEFGPGARRNRFFPALGNHDLHADGGATHRAYFTLPGNERYYDFVAGPVRFFALNSDAREPDGVRLWSAQARWLRRRLAESTAAWNVVYFHHPPYSSGAKSDRGSWMRWPFARWGADVVLSGHEHLYERLAVDGISYFVVGLGGASIYDLHRNRRPETRRRFNADYGALLAMATAETLSFRFVTRGGAVVDRHTLHARGVPIGHHRTAVRPPSR